MIKILAHIAIFTLLFSNLSGQASYGFKDIPILKNIDSLERTIPNLNKNSLIYIKHLITIEFNRIEIKSYKSGIYIKEIDSLSKIRSFEFGTAFVQYSKCVILNISHNALRQTLVHADSALNIFHKLKDSIGIFLINKQTIQTALAILPIVDPDEKTLNLFSSAQSIQKLYKDSTKKLMAATDIYVNRQKNPYYNIVWNFTMFKIQFSEFHSSPNKQYEKKLDSIESYLDRNFTIINKHPQFSYLLPLVYYYQADNYYLRDSFEKSIYYSKLVEKNIHHESYLLVTNNLRLSRMYMQMNNEKYYDSAVKYAKAALSIVERKDFINDSKIDFQINCNTLLADAYEDKKDYKSSLVCFRKLTYDLSLKNFNLVAQSILSYFEFEKIRAQDAQNKQLEKENRIATQRNWFILIVLLLITLALGIILRSYYKLKKAKNEIEKLQLEREKFYSILSHDLRSPIESFNGLANIISSLIRQGKYEDILKISSQIDHTSTKLKSLIENLLSWSIDQQKLLSINNQKVNVTDSIEFILSLYSDIIQEKNIDLVKSIHEDGIIIKTDKYILEAILRNLIDNAVKNSSRNSKIEIGLVKKEEEWVLKIANSTNLTEDKIQMLSEFFRQDNDWQIGHEGIGLGLFIIRDFARKLSSSIRQSYQNGKLEIDLILSDSKL